MKYTPITQGPNRSGGTRSQYRFPNGYGASVIEGGHSYGGREVAVLVFESLTGPKFELCYDTPITDDVIGHLGEDEIEPLLDRIAALPLREGIQL